MTSAQGGRWLAIVNPVAGRGAGAKVAGTLARTFGAAGVRLDVVRTPAAGEGARMARAAIEDGYGVIVAVGGDGTANEVANGLLGSTASLALYPVGTGNDLARNLGYPSRGRELPAFLQRAVPREIDVGLANGRAFLNHVGIGIDGVVAHRARAFGRFVGPVAGYAASSLVAVATYRPVPMRVSLDGEAQSGKYLVIVACNGVHFGGGMKAAPLAQMDDGWLDVSLAGDLNLIATVGALARLYRGTHVDGDRIRAARARSLDIELERAIPMEVDGETARASRLSVRLRERGIRVLA